MSTKVSTDLIDLSSNTGGLVWAKGTTAEQPASATAGEMRVDTTTNTTVVYNGTQWKTLKETAFVVPPVPTHFLVVAGGGGGGFVGGGGGAGGLRTSYGSNSGGGGSAESTIAISLNTSYTITVGDAGLGGVSLNATVTSGYDSIFSTITSIGGGGGGNYSTTAAITGGSGGGGASSGISLSGAAGTANQGFAGGNNTASSPGYGAGGGGGATAIGVNGTSTTGGNGGAALTSLITGVSTLYAGGGGGGVQDGINNPPTATFGTGGSGVGGNGQTNGSLVGESGVFNTGSGGGGGGASKNGGSSWIEGPGGSGGSGVVILRYPTADLPYFTTTGTLNTPSATDTVADTAYPVTNTAYYKLDNNANDSSGNGYNGTASNVTYGNGRFNEAANFNGSSSKITITNFQALSTYSVSMWLKASSQGQDKVILSPYNGTNVDANALAVLNGGTQIYIFTNTFPNNFSISASDTTALFNNNWNNLTYTVDTASNSLKIYINGVEKTTTRVGTTLPQLFSNIKLGVRWDDYSLQFFNGSIDQVRIFSSALAAGDVEDLYNEHFQTKFTDGSDTALKFTGGTGDITFADTAPVFTPSDNFTPITYTGTGGAQSTNSLSSQVGSIDFAPDLVWIKKRDSAINHFIVDSLRPGKYLSSDITNAESPVSGLSLSANGFNITLGGSLYNSSGGTYVAWCWKAGGAARNNTNGSIASLVSANTAAGFSIVSYTGNNLDATIGHGLSSVPEMIIVKNRDNSDVTFNGRWFVYHSVLGNQGAIYLNLADAAISGNSYPWNSTSPTSTVFSVDSDVASFDLSILGNNYIAYCFHSVAGYSKIGSYTGNGSATGPIVTLGFEPAWIMIKRTDVAANWRILDNKRSTTNPINKELYPNLSNAEGTFSALDFLSNGFQIINTDSSYNASGGTYIYMAFATNPT